MIARCYIENNLTQLNNLYLKSYTTKKRNYYSKLAMLELCGWIEESMDEIIQRCANRLLKDQHYKNLVKKEIIDPNYGFDYERNFKKMLISLIGIVNLERLERILDPIKLLILKSSLGTLKKARNKEAHTHLKGVTRNIESPSITLDLFYKVLDGLKDFEVKLKNLIM
jgi:hypothetical protein